MEVTPSTSAIVSTNSTTAYAASMIVYPERSKFLGLTGYNSLASAQFIQFHDSATLPADNAVPCVIFTVAASSNFTFDYGLLGRMFENGLVICNSSTGPTKTIGAANLWLDVQYLQANG